MFDSCKSLFDCGQEKFHPGENTAKQYTMSINKLKNEIDQLRRDLDNKLAASRKVKASISHSIEQQLLDENSDNYYEGSVKNWTLLCKHVYALVMVMVLITYYNSYIQLNYHMFTSNIGTITTVLNLNIYLHCQIVFYIY